MKDVVVTGMGVVTPLGNEVDEFWSNLMQRRSGVSAIEAVVTVQSLLEQRLHPTLNLEEQDPQIELDCCAKGPVEHSFACAASNSFGFGGHNSTLIFQKA